MPREAQPKDTSAQHLAYLKTAVDLSEKAQISGCGGPFGAIKSTRIRDPHAIGVFQKESEMGIR